MGLLFNKIIPFDILVQMPRPFVHRLRDIRIKQLEEANQTLQRPKPKVEDDDENAIKLDLSNTDVKQEVKSERREIKTSPNTKKQDLKIKQEK